DDTFQEPLLCLGGKALHIALVLFGIIADHRKDLGDQDNHPDGGHEPGDHRVGDIPDVFAQSEQSQGDLHQSTQKEDGQDNWERFFEIPLVEGQNTGDHDHAHSGHGGGGPGDLGTGTGKSGGEECDKTRAGRPRGGAHGGSDPPGPGPGGSHGSGRDAPEQAAFYMSAQRWISRTLALGTMHGTMASVQGPWPSRPYTGIWNGKFSESSP